MIKDIKITDCHVHCSLQTSAEELDAFIKSTNTDRANILACTHSRALSLIPRAMELKRLSPDRYYVFGAPDVSAYYLCPDNIGEAMAEYCKKIMQLGCDGIKMLEGKPQFRKLHPVPDFDSPKWEPFFKWAEESGTPILWHVNDPANFWDKDNVPSFAVSQGWLYDDTFVNNEAQYTQVLNVLKNHPGLKICFAHFLFMSGAIDRLSNILNKYPNVCIDLTPGIEMYEDFSANKEQCAEFFGRYYSRILYGTDIGGRCVLEGETKNFDPIENRRRPEIVQTFLSADTSVLIESDGHYLIGRPPFTMHCFGLPEKMQRCIYSENFEAFAGKTPKSIDEQALCDFKTELKEKLDLMKEKLPHFDPDYEMTK